MARGFRMGGAGGNSNIPTTPFVMTYNNGTQNGCTCNMPTWGDHYYAAAGNDYTVSAPEDKTGYSKVIIDAMSGYNSTLTVATSGYSVVIQNNETRGEVVLNIPRSTFVRNVAIYSSSANASIWGIKLAP